MKIVNDELRKIILTKNENDVDGSEGCRIRLWLVKLQYQHFHSIVKICEWISSDRNYGNINIEDTYYNGGEPVDECHCSQDQTYINLVNEALAYIDTTKQRFKDDDDVGWVCTIAANKIRLGIGDEEETMRMLLGNISLGTTDNQVGVVLMNLQAVINKYSHDEDVLLICQWLNETLTEIQFVKGETGAYWINGTAFKKNDRYKRSSMIKVQQAYLFLDYVRNEFRNKVDIGTKDDIIVDIVPCAEIDWICDLAKKIIAIMPNIGRELDVFVEKMPLPLWDDQNTEGGWLCLTKNIASFFDDGSPRIRNLQ